MRANALEQFIKSNTGITIASHNFYDWEKKGLLGEIPRTGGNQRDYSERNAKRGALVAILLGEYWKFNEIVDLIVNKNPDLKERLITMVNDIELKRVFTFRDIIKNWEVLI